MEFSPGDLIAIGAVLLSAGGSIATITHLAAKVRSLEASRVRMGERLGELTTALAVVQDRLGVRRRATLAAPGAAASPDESDEHR